MNSFILRVNCNHLKPLIEHDYLGVRDHLFRCAIASICAVNWAGLRPEHLVIEERHYHGLYQSALVLEDLKECFLHLRLDSSPYQYLEVNDYVEEFLRMKLNGRRQNYLSATIDSGHHFVVGLKLI